jgi:hypothetical protein
MELFIKNVKMNVTTENSFKHPILFKNMLCICVYSQKNVKLKVTTESILKHRILLKNVLCICVCVHVFSIYLNLTKK